MSDQTPTARDSFELPGTERVRPDELRVQDRVFVRRNDEDFWALITAIKPTEDPGTRPKTDSGVPPRTMRGGGNG